MRKIGGLYNDLSVITDKVQVYFAKYNELPINKDVKYVITDSTIKKVIKNTSGTYDYEYYKNLKDLNFEFILKDKKLEYSKENLFNPNDASKNGDEMFESVYYEIDLKLLGNLSLKNATGKYIINENSKTVYYLNGLIIDDEEYNKLPIDYKEINL